MPCEVTQPKSIRSESPDLVTNAFYSIVELEHRDSENLRTSRVRLSHSHPVVASVHRYLLSLISSSSSSSSSQCGIKPRKLPYFLPSSHPSVAQASIISSNTLWEGSFLSRRSEIPFLSCNQSIVFASLTIYPWCGIYSPSTHPVI